MVPDGPNLGRHQRQLVRRPGPAPSVLWPDRRAHGNRPLRPHGKLPEGRLRLPHDRPIQQLLCTKRQADEWAESMPTEFNSTWMARKRAFPSMPTTSPSRRASRGFRMGWVPRLILVPTPMCNFFGTVSQYSAVLKRTKPNQTPLKQIAYAFQLPSCPCEQCLRDHS